MRPIFQWSIGERTIELGRRTLLMGVVNVTPDSFSDGGNYFDRDKAVEHGLKLLEEGADILDIGGESTRPGVKIQARAVAPKGPTEKIPVSVEEELRRVLPVIGEIKRLKPETLVSVDTYKAAVARAAVDAGADIVNDVSGLQWDPEMKKVLAGSTCGLVLMHMRGKPEDWKNLPAVADIVSLVKRELRERVQQAELAGIKKKRVVMDPGIGFGKNLEQNYPLLNRLNELQDLGLPLLVGTSRKSFIAKALEKNGAKPSPQDRLYGSLAAMMISIERGAQIVRVHDVQSAADAVRVADAILSSR